MSENSFENWYNECVEDWGGISGLLASNALFSSPVTKSYVDDQINIGAPILCEKNQIIFSIKDNVKLVIKENGIFWYNELGEEIKIVKSEVLSVALEAVVRSHFDYSSEDVYKKLKKQAFDEMISDIGIQGERLLKLEKLFNEKNIE
jgi:hypothetical protein